jgi:hypothetical protein
LAEVEEPPEAADASEVIEDEDESDCFLDDGVGVRCGSWLVSPAALLLLLLLPPAAME